MCVKNLITHIMYIKINIQTIFNYKNIKIILFILCKLKFFLYLDYNIQKLFITKLTKIL